MDHVLEDAEREVSHDESTEPKQDNLALTDVVITGGVAGDGMLWHQ